MMFLIARMLAPDTASACSACTFQMFEEIFPFMTLWMMLFLIWSVVFIVWHIVASKAKALSPSSGRICIELVVLFLVMIFTGLSVLLFYWAFVVGRQGWLSWKKDDHIFSPGVRKFSLAFNGITSIILALSVAAAYAGYDLNRTLPGHHSSYRTRAYDSMAYSDIRNAKTCLEAYYADHQTCPASFEQAACAQALTDVEIEYVRTSPRKCQIKSRHKKSDKEYRTSIEETSVWWRYKNDPNAEWQLN